MWQCEFGHEWEATPYKISKGQWCRKCGYRKNADRRRKPIEDLRDLAKERGGKCLEENYRRANIKIRWRCALGHEWDATANKVQQGTWCPYCAGTLKLSITEMHEIAYMHEGLCLSTKYVNSDSPLLWQCKVGHQWWAIPDSVKRGSWCGICKKKENGIKQRMPIEFYHLLAEKRGGRCLSTSVSGMHEKLKWQCNEGHIWNAEGNSIKNGIWCPTCGISLRTSHIRNTLNEVNKVALERGGSCLSTEYTTAHKKLLWKCSNDHTWKAPYNSIRRGTWCPICSEGFGERVCREFFEKIFRLEFPKSYPNWLRTEKNTQLELDGYCVNLQLAFEHQGSQHYEDLYYQSENNNFERRKALDEIKRQLCKKNHVRLIEVPEIPKFTKVENLKEFIISECAKYYIDVPSHALSEQITITQSFTPTKNDILNEVREIAKSWGGNCLSNAYLGRDIKLNFICDKGHEWEARPYSILNGSWCRVCRRSQASEKQKLNLDDIKIFAEKKGGKCLSTIYLNINSKLIWECAQGHKWEATTGNIMHRTNPTWCPKCKGYNKTILEMKEYAQKLGGDCLSTDFYGVKKKLKWICQNGHEWEATPDGIINAGRWCKECARSCRRKTQT